MQKLPKLLPAAQPGATSTRAIASVNFKPRRPGLSTTLVTILHEVHREIGFLSREFDEELIPTEEEVSAIIERASARFGIELSSAERDELLEHVEKDQRLFGILQSLVDDPSISDIIVTNYSKISIQQSRKNLTTDLSFPSQETYEAFVEKLLLRAGTTYSTKRPISDGMIGSYARVHIVHKSICESGPYLTIRLNRFSTVSISDLVSAGLGPKPLFEYLQALVRAGLTVLIVGEVGTGKTTLVRALSSTIPTDESILVIEDTPEIKLEHPHVRYVSTREANSDGAGRVSPSECIRGGMRMAMNRIIFGEIRDAEAAEAFVDVCASGHPGLSTIHARSAKEAMTRLELFLGRAQRGVVRAVVNEQIVTAVHVVVFVSICKMTGKRRIINVQEIGPVSEGLVRHRDMFRYQVRNHLPTWNVQCKISAHRDLIEEGRSPSVLSSLTEVLNLGIDKDIEMAGRSVEL